MSRRSRKAAPPRRSHVLRNLFLLVLAATVGLTGWFAWYATHPLPVGQTPTSFTLEPGGSLRSIARQLTDSHVLPEPWRFILLAKLMGQSQRIQAGSYELVTAPTPLDLLTKLTNGDVTQASLTIVEGWSVRDLRAAIARNPDLKHDTLQLSDAELLADLGLQGGRTEGLFFPDTYHFPKGSSERIVFQRAAERMRVQLAREWPQRVEGLPYKDPYEALIMASIVEKETGQSKDRPMIAAVFVNRLRKGMRLQTDPSVIYGLGDTFDGNLTKQHLLTDTPYNTYTRTGLPPTPIALPSLASLRAALHPAASPVLYFVARGDGSSQFSSTLAEHNQAVSRYQRKQ